jgi:transcriptional regulator
VYIPAHFAAGDLAEIAAFVDRAGAADLVTFDGTRPVATLLPIIWERPDLRDRRDLQADLEGPAGLAEQAEPGGAHGRLLGHIALANPQWSGAQPGVPALAIVHGPQAYISPSWYESAREHGRVVPTWNYTSVHFTGPVTFHRDEGWLRDVVTRLTERHEAGRPDRWWVDDAPEQYIAGQLRAIVGVEMAIERIEAKDKLSQNRPPEDRAHVITALRAEPASAAHAIADLMSDRYDRSGR